MDSADPRSVFWPLDDPALFDAPVDRQTLAAAIDTVEEELDHLRDALTDLIQPVETAQLRPAGGRAGVTVRAGDYLVYQLNAFARDADRFRTLRFDQSRAVSPEIEAELTADLTGEFLAAAALLMLHLARLAEDVIVWASAEYSQIELDDAYTTGSSIMPQKKNPDVAELVRGKAGRAYGNLVAALAGLKGVATGSAGSLMAESRVIVDTGRTILGSLRMMSQMLATARLRVPATAGSRLIQPAGAPPIDAGR